MKEFERNAEGFTLIELIVVMAIIAVLVLLAAPSFLNYTKDAKVTAMKQDTKILSDAAEMYHVENEEWPALNKIEEHGIGGVDELYELDDSSIESSIKNIKGDYSDYGIAISGKNEGNVFHLNGVQDSDGDTDHGNDFSGKDSIRFKGKDYQNPEDIPEDNNTLYTYKKTDAGYEVTGFNNIPKEERPKEISIPSEWNNSKVTGIASYSFKNNNLETVILPSTIKDIGMWAFWNNNISQISIPSSVENIAWGVFNENNLPSESSYIYERLPGGKINKSKVVSYGGKETDIVIPENVKEIGREAFKYNSLTSLVIPKHVINIGIEAFNSENLLPEEQAIIYARDEHGREDKSQIVSYGGVGGHI